MKYGRPSTGFDRKAYRRDRYMRGVELRRAWIEANGPCQRCGSANNLQVDHIDPRTKSLQASAIWTSSEMRRRAELAKCQVLCLACHNKKTFEDVVTGLSAGKHQLHLTHCRNGHEYTEQNTGRRAWDGRRMCRTCRSERRNAK